ncbi:hypothetical protein [Flavobacterium silvaticum]|uniref:Sensor of ECF-type sigma factor n=1 Tax=Flavobacterium silvaticum TaxID=1852020 RepID=A0A972JHP7_9FLAO|nr:hypothetical protein [Flavobacterium silvaticum]NMH27358.1 hypothetical protein [Flavobacterium silvaticum]
MIRNLLAFFILTTSLVFAQPKESRMDRTIKTKVMMMQNFVHMGDKGEESFWQTKGRVTFAIVNYTEEQNVTFKDLFIAQYRELLPIYNKMIKSYDDNDTKLFVKTLIRQEDDYRKLLTPEQLKKYSDALAKYEQTDQKQADAYNSLFFSDSLLAEYKKRT